MKRLYYLIIFFFYIVYELIVSSLSVAAMVLRPGYQMRPGVVAVPIPGETELEIMLLANLITLTPGSLTLDVSSDKKHLYVHSIDMKDADSVRDEIMYKLERHVMRIL